jgi:hypothetical protein
MADRRRLLSREDLLLTFAALLLGLAAASAFAAYRAVSASAGDAGERLGEFGMNLLWPGGLILLGVGAAVWFGWKANID